MVEFFDYIQQTIHCPDVGVGAKILSPFLVDIPCRKYPRKIFFGNTDARISLSILQQDVVFWLVFLY